MMNFFFHASAASVLPFWFVMIFFPHKSWTKKLVSTPWIILPPTMCYLVFLIPNIGTALSAFSDASPETLAALSGELWGASLFWAYAGAFDLFVGRWIYHDSLERKYSFWLVSPILFICILFGPLAFTLYGCLRGIKR